MSQWKYVCLDVSQPFDGFATEGSKEGSTGEMPFCLMAMLLLSGKTHSLWPRGVDAGDNAGDKNNICVRTVDFSPLPKKYGLQGGWAEAHSYITPSSRNRVLGLITPLPVAERPSANVVRSHAAAKVWT